MGIFAGNTIGSKKKKDYTNIFKLNIIITSAKEKRNNYFNNSNNNKNYKKIKISKPNKYYNKQKKFKF